MFAFLPSNRLTPGIRSDGDRCVRTCAGSLITGVIGLAFLAMSTSGSAQVDKATILSALDADYDRYRSIAHTLWENPELGYLETRSSALLKNTLADEGFTIDSGVADIPTAFTATFGSSGPVIGILGEYDALPGMSQAPAHSWQAVAAGGMSIGYKGMMVAAKTIALTAVDLYTQPELLVEARGEFQGRIGPDFQYQALLGDREPALDYRK